MARQEAYIEEGQFAPGSMLPKIEACLDYVQQREGGKALITSLAKAKEVVADKLTGTIIKEIYVPKKIINIVQK